jgi:pimeloyl-ACP methyl ester carboxylesterase
MLDSLLAEGEAEAALSARILERAGGTPLFIEETVRRLLDDGALAGAPGALRVTGPVDAVDIPASVQAVIAARIDRLDFRSRSVLQAAAVIGSSLPVAVLERVVGDEITDVGEPVTALLAAELMTEQRVAPPELGFRHALVRDVAYESLPRERRRTLHARAGAAFEALRDASVHAPLDVVAEHYQRGEQWGRAAPMALRAARQAKERYEHGRALALGQIALECARQSGDGNALAIDAHVLIGDMHGLAGDLDAANRAYNSALALAPAPDVERLIRNRYHHSRVATREGTHLSYAVNGSGAETILFLIPVAYDLSMFQPTIELLCDVFRLVTPEPRGNGRSDPVSDAFTFSDWVDDVAAVIEHLDAGPVHVVGQSRGASIALSLTDRRPELVKSLVLIGLKSGLAAYGSWIEEFAESLAAGESERLARILTEQVFSEPDSTDLIEQHVRAMCAIAPETILWFFRNLPDFDASELSPKVSARTLIVHGTEDLNTPVEDGRLIASLMPNAAFRPFPRRGHLPNFTARAEFCEVVTAFVRGDAVPGVVVVRGDAVPGVVVVRE